MVPPLEIRDIMRCRVYFFGPFEKMDNLSRSSSNFNAFLSSAFYEFAREITYDLLEISSVSSEIQ